MSISWRVLLAPVGGAVFVLATAHCGSDSSSASGGAAGTSAEAGATASAGTGTAGDSTSGDAGSTGTGDCDSATTNIDKVVCAADAFLATLPTAQLALVNLAYTDDKSRTLWSNLPGQARAGVKMGDLSTESQAAALALMNVVLSADGQTDLTGVRAADDYLGAQSTGTGGPGGGGATYASTNYVVSVLGTPSATGNWEVMFGGHHMAYNINYIAGVGYPIPNHLGVEPKGPFTQDGTSYAPMDPEGAAMLAVIKALPDLSAGYLTGQTFSDVLIGPAEYGTGSSAAAVAKYPTGDNRKGVLVSSLPQATQDLVTAAIEQWVNDYDAEIADPLLAAYTSADAYADTLLAWGGPSSTTIDPDVDKTYMRIDGPRVWIELSCQAGVVIAGKTHYHSIYRDKSFDYGATLP